ncbi:MAG TPA: membrane protein insertion efficiency factor YidD [Clostridiales bacterium]|nr:membrane protein insertion efficiency factor YidD [Clostridiales bacterium]
MFRKIIQFFLIIYKKTLSKVIGNDCIFTPTCSMYMYDAVEEYGAFRGFFMGIWRLLRCNPFNKGGFDPVKENLRKHSHLL